MVFVLFLFVGMTPAKALREGTLQSPDLQISVDQTNFATKNGDKVEFHTMVTNTDSVASPPLIIAMNIINVSSTGDVVDPEDWSPQRTQYLEMMAPGESATQTWILNTILEGNYMVYVVLIPAPESNEATSQPVVSPGVHVTVSPFTRINPGGILPFAIGIPLALVLVLVVMLRIRRQGTDASDSK
jgi:hypothetical protein